MKPGGEPTLFAATDDAGFDQIAIVPLGDYYDIFVANLQYSLGQNSDLVPTHLDWNTSQGGVDFKYKVTGAALSQDTTAQLYWASGTTTDTILEPATTPITIPQTVQVDQEQTVHLAPSDFPGGPAPGAKYLLAVVDPDNKINEGIDGEANNVLPLAVPLQITPFQQTDYAITADAKMPDISAEASIVGISPDPTASTVFKWTTVIRYDASNSPHGPDRPTDTYAMTQTVQGGAYHPHFTVTRGGVEFPTKNGRGVKGHAACSYSTGDR